ncbi:MAG: SRPBCC domain-containing protein [Pseudomonadota bacterium]
MELIFKALNDRSRRGLLDALRETDGQTLSELESKLLMTRFGVMKHLKILEAAHLITTKKSGRFKYHYLNAVPLQQLTDRWIEPLLQQHTTRAILNLKSILETNMAEKPDFIHQTFIRTSQDALWSALTDPKVMAAYHFLCDEVRGKVILGKNVEFIQPDGSAMLRQTTIDLQPKTRLEMSFEPLFFGPEAPHSRMVYLIEPQGAFCKLTIEHYNLLTGQESIAEGWARLAASLKSYLETGVAMKGAA